MSAFGDKHYGSSTQTSRQARRHHGSVPTRKTYHSNSTADSRIDASRALPSFQIGRGRKIHQLATMEALLCRMKLAVLLSAQTVQRTSNEMRIGEAKRYRIGQSEEASHDLL